jgi:type I restriction enzyme, S subunit
MTRVISIGSSSLFISDGNYSSKYPKKDEFLESGVPFISANNLRGGKIIWENMKFISPQQHQSLKKGHLKTGDVLLVTRGSLGTTAYVTKEFEDANINAQLVLLRADGQTIDKRYLYYVVSTDEFFRAVLGHSSGTAQPQLPIGALKQIPIRLHEFSLQKKIAAILSAYDDVIENNTRRMQILEEMARRIYEEWFVRFRFPGHETIRSVESEFGVVPQGWNVTSLEKECDYIARGVTPQYAIGSGRFIINQRANQGGYIERSYLKELSPELVVPDKKFARYGDLLVNCLGEGTIGRVVYFTERNPLWAVDQHMTICRSERNPEFINYAYFYLSSSEGQKRIDSVKTGATNMTMFNISTLRSFSIIKPEFSLLRKFYEASSIFWEQRRILDAKNHNLRRTRDLLIPKLMSGELDVSTFPDPVSD